MRLVPNRLDLVQRGNSSLPSTIIHGGSEILDDIEYVNSFRADFLRDEELSCEEEQLITDKVVEFRRQLEPEITKEMEECMEPQSRWQLYLGLFLAAAAVFGIVLLVVKGRKIRSTQRKRELRDKTRGEVHPHPDIGWERSTENRLVDEIVLQPDAYGIKFPSSSEWGCIREFLKSNYPRNLQQGTLYLDERVVDGLRGYGHWKSAFVEALCKSSNGKLEIISPSVGDAFDLSTMERDVQLTGECKVTLVVSLGLREIESGRIVCKAFVSVC